MATTKLSKENNILKIEITGGVTTYRNAAWYDIESYDNDSIALRYLGSDNQEIINIQFDDFQDGEGTAYGNISDIVTYLSDKIG